ncbi:MAG: hypothetical protein IKG08_09415 [Eubacterium sp.]|nr:hypothetical protein [Eubacterium sp.]MBR3276801.1 hypothetical protein [Eubacterium sp.]
MADGISVERAGLEAGIKVCESSISVLETVAANLQSSYSNAGSGWSDENYAKLGRIVQECVDALKKPIPGIQDSERTINEMIRILDQTEEIF